MTLFEYLKNSKDYRQGLFHGKTPYGVQQQAINVFQDLKSKLERSRASKEKAQNQLN